MLPPLCLTPSFLLAAANHFDNSSPVAYIFLNYSQDGATPYPSATAALNSLQEAGIKIVILSNSSRRSAHAQAKLTAMFPSCPDLAVITSGELSRELFRSADCPVPTDNVLHTNWAGRGSIDPADNNLKLTIASAADAFRAPDSFSAIVAHGTEAVSVSPSISSASGRDGKNVAVEELEWPQLIELVKCVVRARPETPMVCVNPDIVTVDGGVGLRPMPGALARAYEEAGGRSLLLRVGKPGALAYEAALSELETSGVKREEVVCIGDSVAHDIAGAHGQGLASLYIAGGIDAGRFGLDSSADGPSPREDWTMDWDAWDELVSVVAPALARPEFVLDFFKW